LLVYLHGGGFSQGSLPTWAPLARQVVRGSGAAVLSVDYPLAPEHPFPAALNAVVDVIEAVPRMADEWRVDAQALAIGGDSAGANLALAAAMALRAQDKARLRFLLLFYGVYSSDIGSPSWRALGQGQFGLSVDMMKEIWRYYTGQEQPAGDWRVTPLDGDFRGLPPSWACVGTLDPLLDDNLRLRDRFADAGGTCVLRICERLPHAFVRHVGRVPSVDAALAEGIAALRDAVR
jgi:acetyl esterase